MTGDHGLTVAEVAKRLAVSESTVLRMIRDGECPAVRIRRKYVVPHSWVDGLFAGALAKWETA